MDSDDLLHDDGFVGLVLKVMVGCHGAGFIRLLFRFSPSLDCLDQLLGIDEVM